MKIEKTKNFLLFDSPLDLWAYYDPDVQNGTILPYSWHADFHKALSLDATTETVNRVMAVAANGSGKSKCLLAPAAIYLTTQYDNALICGTTSSAEQMHTQTERYIRQLATQMNIAQTEHPVLMERWGPEPWDIKQRHLEFKPTGSLIDLFVTDEAGKAEGRHPIRANSVFAFLYDEAKSVPEKIFEATDRCFGMTHRIMVTSPGGMFGRAYSVYSDPNAPWFKFKIDYTMCPHIKKDEVDEILRSRANDPAFIRSALFAEFTSSDESVVIIPEIYLKQKALWHEGRENKFGELRAGIDISAGGDEFVISVWHGNVQIAQYVWITKDTSVSVQKCIEHVSFHKIPHGNVWADDGGIGRGVLDNLREKGFTFNRILNGARALDKTRFANRGTELWWNLKGYAEAGEIKFLPDDKLERQLLNRYYIQRPQTDLLALEPKPDARGRGHPSPDRADAAALAWVPYRWPQSVLPLGVTAPVQKTVKVMDDETLEMALEARKKKENADEILELSFSGSHRLSQYRNLNRRNKLYA